jgi:hypothetical protein
MAEWVIRVPGEPERVVAFSKPFVVGRADGCEVTIAEKKASKRHVELAPLEGSPSTWLATDLQTSNGTFVEERRFLRAVVADGEVVRVGDSTLTLRATPARVAGPGASATPAAGAVAAAGAPPPSGRPAIVLAPSLRVEASPPAPAATDDDTAGDEPADDAAAAAASAADERRSRAAGVAAVRRGAIVLTLGVGALVLAYVMGGAEAERRQEMHAETTEYKAILEQSDAPFEMLEGRVTWFRQRHPQSALLQDLDRLLDKSRVGHAAGEKAEAELDSIQRDVTVRPESEVVGRLVALRESVGDDPRYGKRIDKILGAVERHRDEVLEQERAAAEGDADKAIARNDPSTALRRLRAFREGHPGLSADASSALARKETVARNEAVRIADAALAKAETTTDPDLRRRVLVEGMLGLDETNEGDRIRAALARVTGGAMPAPAAAGGGASGAPTAPADTGPPPASAALLARAADANRLSRERSWAKAAAEFEALSTSDAAPRVKQEWAARALDLQRIASLVKDLGDAAAASGDKGVRVALSTGTFDVLAVDPTGVRAKRGEKTSEWGWAELSVPDLIALLSYGKPSPDRHLALAILAADLGDRKAAIEHLVPLAAVDTHKALAFDVMARRLEGRASVPQGGYQVLDGELVDGAEYARRMDARHVASLRLEAGALVEKAAADASMHRVASLRARRDELDKRRAYALLAIFDERHWPYPHPAEISGPYEQVWNEVVKRTKAVREIWDEAGTVRIPAGGELKKHVDRHAAVVAELESKGVDVSALRDAMAPYALYVGETLSIRTFFRDAEEKRLLAYDRWVMDVYNPARDSVATPLEREQTRITNEYRMMMGFMIKVDPSDDPIDKIDGHNVAQILDKGREVAGSRVPLHAVRIDDRLVSSARGHSLDMAKRGYFAHEAPANPATGEPATTPFDRMAKAGYSGLEASENIAQAGGPQEAHDRWLHSSGHHRNILSNWADQGVGQSGSLWTQNFGRGGGAEWTLPEGTTAPSGDDDKKGKGGKEKDK